MVAVWIVEILFVGALACEGSGWSWILLFSAIGFAVYTNKKIEENNRI